MTDQVLADTTPGPSGAAYNAWYSCPLKTAAACLLDPYIDQVNDQTVLMTSVALPLQDGGKVIGVIGIDISLAALQALAESANRNLYEGQGDISFISPAGLLAAHTRDAAQLGKPMDNADQTQASALRQALQAGQPSVVSSEQSIGVMQPVQPIPGAKTWGILIQAPKPVVLTRALALADTLETQRTRDSVISWLVGIGAIVLGLVLMNIMARRVTRPILSSPICSTTSPAAKVI